MISVFFFVFFFYLFLLNLFFDIVKSGVFSACEVLLFVAIPLHKCRNRKSEPNLWMVSNLNVRSFLSECLCHIFLNRRWHGGNQVIEVPEMNFYKFVSKKNALKAKSYYNA